MWFLMHLLTLLSLLNSELSGNAQPYWHKRKYGDGQFTQEGGRSKSAKKQAHNTGGLGSKAPFKANHRRNPSSDSFNTSHTYSSMQFQLDLNNASGNKDSTTQTQARVSINTT